MNKEKKSFAKWKKIKSKGIESYIINMAILYYGLAFFIIYVLLTPIIDNNSSYEFIRNETFDTKLNHYIIIAPLFGMLMGYIRYKRFERKYK